MKINMFEGARRITKLVAVIWVVGCFFFAFEWSPTIHAYFRVEVPGNTPIRMNEQECDTDDANESFYSKYTSKGTSVSGAICFKSVVSDDGRKLIPFKIVNIEEVARAFYNAQKAGDKEAVLKLGNYLKYLESRPLNQINYIEKERYSNEVSSYTKQVIDDFKLSKADEDWIDGELWPTRLKKIKEGTPWIIGGVVCLYIFSWCVGWIVRGFAGIPLGQDRKPDDM